MSGKYNIRSGYSGVQSGSPGGWGSFNSSLVTYTSSSYVPYSSQVIMDPTRYPPRSESPFIIVSGIEYKVEFDPNGEPIVYRKGKFRKTGQRPVRWYLFAENRWFKTKKEEKSRVLAEFTLRKMASSSEPNIRAWWEP